MSKQDKTKMSYTIVNRIRRLVPPGRFLKIDPKTNLWYEIGDKEARRKTSQLLREKALKARETFSSATSSANGSSFAASIPSNFSNTSSQCASANTHRSIKCVKHIKKRAAIQECNRRPNEK